MRIPKKTQEIPPTPIDLINSRANIHRANGKDIINMGQGMPGFAPIAPVKEIALNYLDKPDTNSYSLDAGLPALRQELARFLINRQNIVFDPETEILITAGGNQAFVLSILTLLEPGDKVLLPSPVFFNHAMAIKALGCEPIEIPLDPHTGFQLTMDDLQPYLNSDPKMLVIVSPNNPTGAVYQPDSLLAIAHELAARNITIVNDETYGVFTYDNARHFSLASVPELRSHVITINSFSKSFSLGGWRLGYVIGDATFIQHAIKIQDSMIICAPVIAQKIVTHILENFPDDVLTQRVQILNERRLTLADNLVDKIPSFSWQPTCGAIYAFVHVKDCTDSTALALDILDNTFVSTIPGNAFGKNWEGYLRLSYGNVTATDLQQACNRLKVYFEQIPSKHSG